MKKPRSPRKELQTETRETTEGPQEQGDDTPEEMVQLRYITGLVRQMTERLEKPESDHSRPNEKAQVPRKELQTETRETTEGPQEQGDDTPEEMVQLRYITGLVRQMTERLEKPESDHSRPNEKAQVPRKELQTETRETTEGPQEQGANAPEKRGQVGNIIEKYEKPEMERHRSKVSDFEVRRNIQREEPTRLEKKIPVCTGQVRRMRQCFEKQESDQSRPNEPVTFGKENTGLHWSSQTDETMF
ncbi:hypothetical protein NQD34_002102 [Periophthalmus magnuspinnatus]|nr:hypothetical protein NQD34_002102 [Periophthalmus magnuspinnatus]